MAVKIRLRRMGQKKAPFYRIVVADSRSKRDGKCIAEIGTYDPNIEPSAYKVNEEEAKKWIKNYDEKAEKLGKEVIAKKGEKTYLTVLASQGQFMVFSDAGLGTVVNDDMKLARPKNMPKQDSITLPMVSMEGLTKIDADHIIVIATDSDKKDLEKSTVWPQIRAVKEGNVTMLDATPYFAQSYNPIGRELLLESVRNELSK